MKPADLSGFSRVDQVDDPNQFIVFLDKINAWPFFRDEQKPKSIEMLDVKPGQQILDVGCGLGDVTMTLAKIVGTNGRTVGLDFSERLIAEARKRAVAAKLTTEFVAADATTLNFPDNSFDRSRADRVLKFMQRPHQAVREMVRVTRPGGRLCIGEIDLETAIVDSPYRALTRKLLDFWCDSIPNGWIGRQLPALYLDLGVRDVQVVPMTFRMTSFAQWNAVFQIGVTVAKAREANVVSDEEAKLWLEQLQESDRRGRFSLAVTLFLVAGQKT
jgi:ubiquinone/menaquinone biosynthesis C-methylase UbiE